MAYVDLFAAPSTGLYYRKLAKITSLECSAYCSEVLDIGATVLRKKKFDDEGFFKLDRKWVEDRTTICLEDQLNYDSTLQNIGILESSETDPNKIRLHLDVLAGILIDDTNFQKVNLVKKNVKVSRSQAAANKKAGIIITMKKCISEIDSELRSEYEAWIDSVYAAGRFTTKKIIENFESTVNSYTTDPTVKKSIISEAITTGYTDPTWIINRYESNRKSGSRSTATKLVKEQRTSTGVNENVEF